MKYFKCNVCGNLVGLVIDGGGDLVCCGELMEKLVEKTKDEGNEKHLPVVTQEGSNIIVKVGEESHPMTDAHYICFIVIKYNNKTQKVELSPNDLPSASFEVSEDFDEMEVYEYCSVHGLWKSEYKK